MFTLTGLVLSKFMIISHIQGKLKQLKSPAFFNISLLETTQGFYLSE